MTCSNSPCLTGNRVGDAAEAIAKVGEGEPHIDADDRRDQHRGGRPRLGSALEAVRTLDTAGVETHGLALRRPSLDDVFLALTGHAAEEKVPPGRRRGRRRSDQSDTARTAIMTAITGVTATRVRHRNRVWASAPGGRSATRSPSAGAT